MNISKSILKKQVKHASSDKTKPAIMGILIDGNRSVATDGYRLSIIDYKVGCDSKLFIPSDLIEMILKVKFTKKQVNSCNDLNYINIEGDILTFYNGIGFEQTKTKLKPASNYPDYEQVIPKELERKNETVCLNVQMLGELIADDDNRVKFDFYGELNPVVARSTIEGLTVTNVLMPIRIRK